MFPVGYLYSCDPYYSWRGHWPLGFNSSVMMTMSSTASASVLCGHFFRAVSDGTYSFSHRLQKFSTISWLSWNCRSYVWVMVLVDFNGEYGLAPAWRKWLGVSGSGSSGSTLRWVKGREFSKDVTSAATVASTGSVTSRFFNTTRIACLQDFTSLLTKILKSIYSYNSNSNQLFLDFE